MIKVKVDHALVKNFYNMAARVFPPFTVFHDYPLDEKSNLAVVDCPYMPNDLEQTHVMTFHTFDYGDGAKPFVTWELSVDD